MEEGNKEVHFKDLIHTAKSVEFKSLYIVSDVGALTNLMLPRLCYPWLCKSVLHNNDNDSECSA